jgi:UDP-3-O-[3-hydroxymyristoyl] glucosamine N-acyltransferase
LIVEPVLVGANVLIVEPVVVGANVLIVDPVLVGANVLIADPVLVGSLVGTKVAVKVDGSGVCEMGGGVGGATGASELGATSNDFVSSLPNSPPDATSLPSTLTE